MIGLPVKAGQLFVGMLTHQSVLVMGQCFVKDVFGCYAEGKNNQQEKSGFLLYGSCAVQLRFLSVKPMAKKQPFLQMYLQTEKERR
jgi:hypothetical protein